MEIYLIIAGGGVLVFLVLFLVEVSKNRKVIKENENLKVNIEYLQNENFSLKEKIKELEDIRDKKLMLDGEIKSLREYKDKYETLQEEISKKEKILSELETKLKEAEKFYKEKEEILKVEFENLANKILEDTSKKSLSAIEPIIEKIKEFNEKIEHIKEKDIELKKELEILKELNQQISKEAQNLTEALKGDKKSQGIWGEMVLERVLELSGLRKNEEYFREVPLKREDKQYRPDVIVKLPNNKEVIIDAKTSLNAYTKYIETKDEKFLKEHVKNIKNHIDDLSKKDYENLEGINSLDFILMFIPIENALSEALSYDKDLYEYAFRKKIILTSPTTLLVALRAIESSWRYEKQIENIKDIIKGVENLYSKIVGFLEDFEKIEKSIDSLQKNYNNAKNKLKDGRGNIIRQIENIKEKSGIIPKKEIPLNYKD